MGLLLVRANRGRGRGRGLSATAEVRGARSLDVSLGAEISAAGPFRCKPPPSGLPHSKAALLGAKTRV